MRGIVISDNGLEGGCRGTDGANMSLEKRRKEERMSKEKEGEAGWNGSRREVEGRAGESEEGEKSGPKDRNLQSVSV